MSIKTIEKMDVILLEQVFEQVSTRLNNIIHDTLVDSSDEDGHFISTTVERDLKEKILNII